MSLNVKPDSEFCRALVAWWQDLNRDRGTRAELRRAKTVAEIIMVPGFHHFSARVKQYVGSLHSEAGRLAAIAGLVAHIKENRPDLSLAAQMAELRNEQPRISQLRFRRLLQVTDRNELFRALRRMINLLDGTVNLCSLAGTVWYWGDDVKKQMALEYYPRVPQKTE